MAAREFKHRYKHDLNSKTYNRWIENELKIRQSKFQSKKVGSRRKALFPDMEEKLNYEFLEMRDKGIKVKEWWFRQTAAKIVNELHPNVDFKYSERWFQQFKSRYSLSLRRPTHTAQRDSESFRSLIQQFHQYLR